MILVAAASRRKLNFELPLTSAPLITVVTSLNPLIVPRADAIEALARS